MLAQLESVQSKENLEIWKDDSFRENLVSGLLKAINLVIKNSNNSFFDEELTPNFDAVKNGDVDVISRFLESSKKFVVQ